MTSSHPSSANEQSALRVLRYFPDSYIQYFDDSPAKDGHKALSSGNFDPKEAAQKQIQGCGVYFTPNAFEGGRKQENLIHIQAVYADIDLAKEGDGQDRPEVEQKISKAVAALRTLECPPHCIIRTKNGIQPIWRVEPTGGEEAVRLFRETEELIIKCFEADPGAKDPARVLRLPGYKHLKNPSEPFVCLLLHDDLDSPLYELAALKDFFGGYLKIKGITIAEKTRTESPVTDRIPAGSRNTTLASIAGSLRHKGLDEGTVLDTLQAVNLRACDPPLSGDEVVRIARSIARYPITQEPTHGLGGIPELVLLNAADVIAEEVDWLWKDRIPKGKMTMIDGDPGQGKSWLSLAIASHITRGTALPGNNGEQADPAKVLLLAAEDGAADTIRPRLESLEADLEFVNILVAVRDAKGKERHLSLKDNLDSVEAELAKGGYGLFIIDPLNAYLGGVDSHKDADMRGLLTPLARLAEKHGLAVVCIRHLTKSKREKGMYRGQGSIAYLAAARVAHIVGISPHNPSERVIVCVKNNLVQPPPSFAFEIMEGKFTWKGETDVNLGSLLKNDADGRKSAVERAKEFLIAALSAGTRPAAEVIEEAKKIFISETSLKRARSELKVEASHIGGSKGHWAWTLPDSKESNPEETQSRPSLNSHITEEEKSKEAKDDAPAQLTLLESEKPGASKRKKRKMKKAKSKSKTHTRKRKNARNRSRQC